MPINKVAILIGKFNLKFKSSKGKPIIDDMKVAISKNKVVSFGFLITWIKSFLKYIMAANKVPMCKKIDKDKASEKDLLKNLININDVMLLLLIGSHSVMPWIMPNIIGSVTSILLNINESLIRFIFVILDVFDE